MNYIEPIYEKSNPELVKELGARFKEYRLMVRMTQKEVSQQSGVSIFTIRAFETQRATNITLTTFYALIRAIGFLEEADKLLPHIGPPPELVRKYEKLIQKKTPKRIKHGK